MGALEVPRTYYYISDTKVSQVLAQMAAIELVRCAARLRIDVELLSRRDDGNLNLEQRIARVRVAEDYLRQSGEIGALNAHSGGWFQGSLQLRCGLLADGVEESTLLLWGGRIAEGTVALVGSRQHLIDTTPSRNRADGGSYLPIVAEKLEKWAQAQPGIRVEAQSPDAHMLSVTIQLGVEKLGGVPEWMSFVGRHLYSKLPDEVNHSLLLGTPLYVAAVAGRDYADAGRVRPSAY